LPWRGTEIGQVEFPTIGRRDSGFLEQSTWPSSTVTWNRCNWSGSGNFTGTTIVNRPGSDRA